MDSKKSEKPRLLRGLLSDHLSDTWKLLSETSGFLGKTSVFTLYEEDLRFWRHDLQNAGENMEKQKRVRQEIIGLRTSLRKQGFDLSLAGQKLIVDGFRNDASLAEGFRRVVIFFCDDDLFWLAGEDNHITLAELLERKLPSLLKKRSFFSLSKHYLWYCRKGNNLVLSGSDTETKEDFERLKVIAQVHTLEILGKLKDLK